MWAAAAVTALLDLVLYALLARFLRRERFSSLLYPLMGTAALTWCGIYTWAAWTFWESCYGRIFPPLALWAAPLFGICEGLLLGWLFWLVGRRLPFPPVLVVGLLGALQSFPGHLVGIFGRSMLDACPMLNGVSPVSALVFGMFEFALYWAAILALAWLAGRLAAFLKRSFLRHRPA